MSFQNAFFRGLYREPASEHRKSQAIDTTRAAGRFGATRIPLEVMIDDSLSDTFVGRLPGALSVGHEQRTTNDEYSLWLAANADRLSFEVAESGVEDGCAWLRQQYTIETGKVA